MSRVRKPGNKYMNTAKYDGSITGSSKMVRIHSENEDYHKASTLSSWLFMKYDMTYKAYRNKSKARRDELRLEYFNDTGNQERCGRCNSYDFFWRTRKRQEQERAEREEQVRRRRERLDMLSAIRDCITDADRAKAVLQIMIDSENTSDAKKRLMERYGLNDNQARAITDMRMRSFTRMERERLKEEGRELEAWMENNG